jgi:hypothetical protein
VNAPDTDQVPAFPIRHSIHPPYISVLETATRDHHRSPESIVIAEIAHAGLHGYPIPDYYAFVLGRLFQVGDDLLFHLSGQIIDEPQYLHLDVLKVKPVVVIPSVDSLTRSSPLLRMSLSSMACFPSLMRMK